MDKTLHPCMIRDFRWKWSHKCFHLSSFYSLSFFGSWALSVALMGGRNHHGLRCSSSLYFQIRTLSKSVLRWCSMHILTERSQRHLALGKVEVGLEYQLWLSRETTFPTYTQESSASKYRVLKTRKAKNTGSSPHAQEANWLDWVQSPLLSYSGTQQIGWWWHHSGEHHLLLYVYGLKCQSYLETVS